MSASGNDRTSQSHAESVENDPFLRRVEEALRLIQTYDPLQYCRLMRDLERVWGVRSACEQLEHVVASYISVISEAASAVATMLGLERVLQRPRIEGYKRTSTPR
jgi:hypothetical protein